MDHQQAAAAGGAGGLAGVAVHDHRAGHDVLGQPDARSCRARGPSRAGSCRRSSSPRGRRSSTSIGGVEPDGDRMAAAGVDARASARGAASSPSRAGAALSSRSGVPSRSTVSTVGRSRDRRHQTGCLLPAVDASPARAPRRRASSAPGSTAIARYSDAIATQSSVSAITAGLQAIGSRSTAKPSARADRERVEAVEVVEAALQRLLQRVALAQPPGEVAGGDLGVVLGLELDALARAACGAGGCGSRASRCARGRGRVRSRTGASRSVVTRLSVAMRVWPSAWLPWMSREVEALDELAPADPPPCRSRSTGRRSSRAARGSARAATPAPRRRRPPRRSPRGWRATSGSPAPNASVSARATAPQSVRAGRGSAATACVEPVGAGSR